MAKTKRAMLIKRDDSTFDKIQAFYIDPENYPLTEAVEEIRQRWIYVMSLTLRAYPKFKIANMLVQDFGLSQAQAYIDIRNAENVFGNISKTESEAFKVMWTEWTKDLLKRAIQRKDLKAESKALDLLAKYSVLNQDPEGFNPAKLENVEIQFKIPKAYLPFLKQQVSQGVDDFNLAEPLDIDHEDVTNEK